ncbi:UNVERIFIED_CONTAM: hypothetical protein GTU68_040927 [Idotea baltica]|nr:hypothetical protein [Idotea baltica]
MHNSIPLDSEHTVSIIGIFFKILDIPGHTLGHIAYYEKTQGWLFSGDTLFSGGCGRVLEGSYEQMHQSLIQLTSLPKATKIYCAHEYTLNNLKFALTVDPENKDLQKYLVEVNHLRKNQQSTIPSTLSLELKINPFLRLKNIESKKLSVEQETISNQEIFTVLRQLKNVF